MQILVSSFLIYVCPSGSFRSTIFILLLFQTYLVFLLTVFIFFLYLFFGGIRLGSKLSKLQSLFVFLMKCIRSVSPSPSTTTKTLVFAFQCCLVWIICFY